MHLTSGLHRSVQQQPDAVAVVDRNVRRTFAELADRVSRAAGYLQGEGLGPGDHVAILCHNSVAYVEAILASLWGGFTFIPLNCRLSRDEIAFQLDECAPKVIVTDAAHERLTRSAVSISRSASIYLTDYASSKVPTRNWDEACTRGEHVGDVRMVAAALAAIVYTGGTTGRPKGVMLEAGNLMASALGTLATSGTPESHRFLQGVPLFHLAGLGSFLQQLQVGSTHFLLPPTDMAEIADVIENDRITMTTLVPTQIRRLVRHAQEHGQDLRSLRALVYGGAPIDAALLAEVLSLWTDLELSQRYGMTELGPVATILTPTDHRRPEKPALLRSAGRPARHVEVRVVEPGGNPVDTGEIGEVTVRSGGMMRGYFKQPAATAQTIKNGWLFTGDLGFLDHEGYLFVVDRAKDMIVSGGENVYSAEVEDALSTHPDVAASAIVGAPDDEWGERVHAVIVARPGRSITIENVRTHCQLTIASYKAPRTFELVDELPLSAAGKVLKQLLRQSIGAQQRRSPEQHTQNDAVVPIVPSE